MRYIFLVLFLTTLTSCNLNEQESNDFYKKVSFLNQQNDSLTINDVVKLYEKGDFNVPMEDKVFYDLKGKEATWISFKIPSSNVGHNLSIWNPFLEFSKLYTLNSNNITSFRSFSLYKKDEPKWNYRFPSWKIEKSSKETIVFIKVKDTKNKSCLKLLLQDEKAYNSFIAQDFSVIAGQVSFLLIIILIVVLLFLNQKRVNILWYGAYVFILTIEFLVHKGLDLQLGLTISPLFHSSKRVLLQNLGLTFALLFFIKFYKFNNDTKRIKKIFISIFFISLSFNIILITQYYLDSEIITKTFMWTVLRICALIVLVLHLILVSKKVLPAYLGLGFTLPIIVFFGYAFSNPKQNLSMVSNFLIDNSFQLAITVEVILILLFIIKRLVKSEFLAINLKNENLELRNSFQNSIAEVEQKERNKLLSNVHDSFGGYLETLKLRLLSKSENTPEKVQEVLDAFYKEYRYLLNSLYSPKINSENFAENLIEFFEKLNQLTNNTIKHHFSIENTQLPPENCVHLYRIISELTTNAIKYSKASEIYVKITKTSNNLIILDVSDNGIGFDIESVNHNSYGLKNIKTRVNAMKGKIEIKSVKNQGTHIVISIPYNE